jgi:hypothetical protein
MGAKAPRRQFVGAVLACTAAASLIGCQSRSEPPAGDLARYKLAGTPDWQVALPAEMREVSGIAVASGGRLFAHGDEEGTLFEVEPRTGKVLKSFALRPGAGQVDLGKNSRDGVVAGDFEDLTIVGDRFFMVTSNGVLVEFSEGEDGGQVAYTAHRTALEEICEVEGLGHHPASESLVLLCKEMRQKAQRGRMEVYALSLRDMRLDPKPRLVVPFVALARVTGAREFNGSALAFVPGGTSLAMIAGQQRLFAEISIDGTPVAGGALDRATLPQPEGMAFLPDGTLLISSEGGKGAATLVGYLPR